VSLSDGETISSMCLAVLARYRVVRDRQTDGRISCETI